MFVSKKNYQKPESSNLFDVHLLQKKIDKIFVIIHI